MSYWISLRRQCLWAPKWSYWRELSLNGERINKQENMKLGTLHLKEDNRSIWGGEGIVSTLAFLSLHAQKLLDADVLLCNDHRRLRIRMCMQCSHESISSVLFVWLNMKNTKISVYQISKHILHKVQHSKLILW